MTVRDVAPFLFGLAFGLALGLALSLTARMAIDMSAGAERFGRAQQARTTP